MSEQQAENPENGGDEKGQPVLPDFTPAHSQKKDETPHTQQRKDRPGDVAEGGIKRKWKEFRNAGTDRHLELFLSFAIVIFAACQLWITYLNSRTSTEQINKLITSADRISDAADSFSDSASSINDGIGDAVMGLGTEAQKMEAARKSSDRASRKSLQATIDNFHQEQRAWISIKITNQLFADRQPLAISTEFDNTGKTPAVKVKTCQVAEIVENSRPNIDISCPPRANSAGFLVIFPGGNSARLSNATGDGGKGLVSKDGFLDQPLMDELRHHTKIVYLYGRIDYSDVFGRPHWVTFCSAMLILPPAPGGLPETHNWIQCQNGNEIDARP